MTNPENLLQTIPNWSWLWRRPLRAIAFGFGSGLAPKAPGTFGTLWAWASGMLFYTLFPETPFFWVSLLLCLGFLLGIWVCGETGDDLGQPDHGGMVWDEIIAFWGILAFILPASFVIQLLAFALFRFFDAVKPGPIRVIDNFFKTWKPQTIWQKKSATYILGFGVMVDDLLAAFFTLLVLALLSFFGLQINLSKFNFL